MQIKIGPIKYDVTYVSELANGQHELCGDFNGAKARIRISADDNAQVQRVTLWHEMIHGILYTAGIRDHSETHVDALAHGLVQLLDDNPHLTALLPQ